MKVAVDLQCVDLQGAGVKGGGGAAGGPQVEAGGRRPERLRTQRSMFCAMSAPVFLQLCEGEPSGQARKNAFNDALYELKEHAYEPCLKLKLWKSVSGVCASPVPAPSDVHGLAPALPCDEPPVEIRRSI